MKIGILTFHDGTNYGGFFQVYTLSLFLKHRNHDVEILNYKNYKHYINEHKALFLTYKIKKIYNNIIKLYRFKTSQKKFLTTKLIFNKKRLNTDKYDVIIIGSDIVWNYQWSFLGKDSIYFGEGLNAKKIIAYAPSCGDVNLSDPIPEFVVEGLEKFLKISVRDIKTANLVQKVLDFSPQIVLDPVLLFDVPFNKAPKNNLDPYILIYGYNFSKQEKKQMRLYAKQNNYKLISVGTLNEWCDEHKSNVNPFDWLTYFYNAECIITTTFHGTLFSIKNEKRFITKKNSRVTPKMETLLNQLNLLSRLYDPIKDPFINILEQPIDYIDINQKLDLLKQESIQYLDKALIE